MKQSARDLITAETNMDDQGKQVRKRNPMTMLEYCKLLLSKVAFDEELLKKEYKKGIRFLNQDEQLELTRWINRRGKKWSKKYRYDAMEKHS